MAKHAAEIGSFIIAPDAIIQELGLTAACVYGKIWRYEKMRDGVCKVAVDTLANDLGLSYKTTLKYIDELVKAKYIFDKTPRLRNRPHIYKTTKRLKSTMENLHTNDEPTVEKLHTTMEFLPTDCVKSTDESELLKEQLKNSIEDDNWQNDILDLYHISGGDNQLQGSLNDLAFITLKEKVKQYGGEKVVRVVRHYALKSMRLTSAIGKTLDIIDSWKWDEDKPNAQTGKVDLSNA